MSGVFISYRRADSAGHAGRLFDHLSMRFGADLIFQDFDDIKPGTDFLQAIQTAIKSCDIMLVLIGPLWLEDAQGRRRLDDLEDVLRLEVSEALQKDVTVIPVLLGGATMPPAEDLPELGALCSPEHRSRPWAREYRIGDMQAVLDPSVRRAAEEQGVILASMGQRAADAGPAGGD